MPAMEKSMMKAFVVEIPGDVDALKLKEIPIPSTKPGWVLVRIKAFGLNRTEIFIRKGAVPNVDSYPLVPGIECVGIIEDPSDSNFTKGQKVAALHPGHMGFSYNGSYAEFALIPVDSIFPVETNLDWATFAAIPEMFQAVWGALNKALECQSGQSLLIRGGTSSLGMTAARMAKRMGMQVLATTRNPNKVDKLVGNGVDHAIIDNGAIADKVHELVPDGVDRVLEVVGIDTIMDSMQATKNGYNSKTGAIVCMIGMLGNQWAIPNFSPMMIPHCVKLTSYQGAAMDLERDKLLEYIRAVEAGDEKINLDRVFKWSEVPEAHRYMEGNQASGKCVVLVDEA